MNINEKIGSFIQSEPDADSIYCVINGRFYPLTDIEKLGYNEFVLRTKNEMPNKLYKFFPNLWTTEQGSKKPINYSHQALINNTVYLQAPELFDDIYDSDLHIKREEYIKIKLRTYCQACNCNINDLSSYDEMIYGLATAFYNAAKENKELHTAFVNFPQNEREQLRYKIFTQLVELELRQFQNEAKSGVGWQTAIHNALMKEYAEHLQRLRNTFRISCFTTNPYSQIMWGGHYADTHKGFCVEYQIDKTNEAYNALLSNLFPVIYCKARPNMTERLTKLWDGEFTFDKMWDLYFHGALRKGIEWVQQNEWRLLLPIGKESTNYNVPFFSISKVFLGNRMAKKDRADIIEICHQKNFSYIGVTRSSEMFEMKDCDILCENCPNYL